MKLLNAKLGYKPGDSFFTEMQENAHNDLQKIARMFGTGIVSGMTPTRNPVDGSVSISSGFGWDNLGRMLNVDQAFNLDFSTITRPAAGKYKQVAVVGSYLQVESGEIQDDIGNSYWKEKSEVVQISFIEGDEAGSEAEASFAEIEDGSFLLVDLSFDNASSGCLSIDAVRRPDPILDTKAPVGKLYIQYPFMPTPDEFFGGGTWENISTRAVGYGISNTNIGDPTSYISREDAGQGLDFEDADLAVNDQIAGGTYDGTYVRSVETYAGLFFRVEGGLSESFNGSIQQGENLSHTHGLQSKPGGSNVAAGYYLSATTGPYFNDWQDIYGAITRVVTSGGNENIPTNRSWRIWIRRF